MVVSVSFTISLLILYLDILNIFISVFKLYFSYTNISISYYYIKL